MEIKIVVYLQEHHSINNAKARELVGLSAPTVRRTLKKMVDKELLIAIGENRNRQYQLVEK